MQNIHFVTALLVKCVCDNEKERRRRKKKLKYKKLNKKMFQLERNRSKFYSCVTKCKVTESLARKKFKKWHQCENKDINCEFQ